MLLKKFKRIILITLAVVIVFTSVPAVGVANASISDLSSQFVGYNIVNGTVVNGVYLRGAPYASNNSCPVYFYKINGNNIYIAPGKAIYVIERENDYFYIAYQYNGTYYCGYVPAGDISCSGYSWSNFDIMWPGLYVIPEGKSRIQNVCYGPGDASYFLRWSTVDVDHTTSTLLLKSTNRYGFIQHMIDDGGVLKYVRGWVWGNYITPWDNYYGSFVPFFYFENMVASCYDNEKDSEESTIYIINSATNQALTVSSAADGTILTAQPFTGSITQEFSLVRTGHQPYSYRLYSQYADKFVEFDHDTANGAFARVKTSTAGKFRDEFATIPWSWENGNGTKVLLGVRSSGFYNAFNIDSSNRIIMHKREAVSTYDWNIRPKTWKGGLNFKTVDAYGDITVKYAIDSNISTYTHVKPEMVKRAAEYWNICAEANLQSFLSVYDFSLVHDNSDPNSVNFIVKYVSQSAVLDDFKEAYAYIVAEDSNGSSIIDNGLGYVYYHRDWAKVELCIVRENIANLSQDDAVKILAHEFGHCLKMPHTAVNNVVESVLNTGSLNLFPDFKYLPLGSAAGNIAEYDRVRLGKKQY